MDNLTNGLLDLHADLHAWTGGPPHPALRLNGVVHAPGPRDPETLRRVGWEIGERKPGDAYAPEANHVGLGVVAPGQGFAFWRVLPDWVERAARQKGDAWRDCRLVLRVYDISFVQFNGLNAHHMQDHPLPALSGRRFFPAPRFGAWHLAEVGFLLRNGEFVPAARSRAMQFPLNRPSAHGSQAGLYVDDRGRKEEIGNVWEQERILRERRRPRLKNPLRLAAFAWEAAAAGHDGGSARFVSELAVGQRRQGHEVHVFLPVSAAFTGDRRIDGVHYHTLDVGRVEAPLDRARSFARAADRRLQDLPPFDLLHLHEWMSGLDFPRPEGLPAILSLTSVEATRRNGGPASDLSRQIERAERDAAAAADFVLTPDWLRERAAAELGLDGARVRAFPMEGRLPNEWECPLDYGQVKGEIGVGPLDRLLVFVGPVEHAAGVDLLLDALPVLLNRAPQLRLAFVGMGGMYGELEHRARRLGVAHAVRLLGHVEGPQVTRLMRAAEALVLPSRFRVPFDDAVVDLARRAGRPVVTTHGGPAQLVRHEDTGVVTYDNPGSMVWALDRILGDPGHAERMGRNGRRESSPAPVWGDVARHYLDLCTTLFPVLTEAQW